MMVDDSDNDVYSEEENVDPAQHETLIKNVLNLHDKNQRVNKPSRTEPSLQVSEFNLFSANNESIELNDLTKSFNKKGKLKHVDKKLKKLESRIKTLPKPLEKPQAERIRRAVGYEKARLELERWDAVVAAHRSSDHIKFPLNTDFNLSKKNKPEPLFRLKTELESEIEEIRPKVEIINVEQEEKVPLTLKEMLEKRREAAKLRAHMSFKEAKARRQNKIKSKKYHRIQRREKFKKQLEEFELLQKTDPEAALQKLEEIEKARAEERITLRHKGTGKWAKSKQIRAKYDKESRKVLAQQLLISKDLTQKVKLNESSDSELEDDAVVQPIVDMNNPWVNKQKSENEINKFLSGYRKFWEQEQKKKLNNVENSQAVQVEKEETQSKPVNGIEQQIVKNSKPVIEKKHNKKLRDCRKSKVTKSAKPKLATKQEYSTSCIWNVTTVDNQVDKVFDEYESKLEEKLNSKYAKLKKMLKSEDKSLKKTAKKKTKKEKTFDLTLNKQVKRPIIDQELTMNEDQDEAETSKEKMKLMMKVANEIDNKSNIKSNGNVEQVERKIKIIQLNTKLPNLLITDDNEEEDVSQREAIVGAFEDEDVVEEFNKEKQEDIENSKPKDIDLTLPGWGSWGGKDLPTEKRKRKRFIMKMPKKVKRRDENKGDLIIFEGGNKDIKNHLVSDLPFPFTTVKDFEASIRQPLGSTFVPETAFRKLTLPPIRTQLGAIIEPLSEEILLKEKYLA